jgi:hypothetical protein
MFNQLAAIIKWSRGGCAKSVISHQAQRRRESSGDLRADRVGTDNEEVVDRGGQHHELPNRAKDQDGHRHVMSNTIEGNLRTTPGYKILSEYVYRCRHRQNNSLL